MNWRNWNTTNIGIFFIWFFVIILLTLKEQQFSPFEFLHLLFLALIGLSVVVNYPWVSGDDE